MTADEPGGSVPIDRPERPVGLYVHVPFCVSVCPYCDFVVYAGAEARGPRNRIETLVDALVVEIGLRAGADRADPVGRPLATVYIGGGTPSLLPSDALDRILDAIRTGFGIEPQAEVTLELNPGVDERGDPAAQAAAGVTRLSIGAQSFTPTELKRLGRRHSPGDIGLALIAAREAGIGSINLDLLYDVPGQTLGSWTDGLERAIGLAPDHL
ncbi:MAG TPA: radical SAM protein, partial [Candidatus Limnocylindrales bacterium]